VPRHILRQSGARAGALFGIISTSTQNRGD
jgi:hypothetical protein